jgi:hypothetical protein
MLLEAFRPNERPEEIHEKADRHDSDDDKFGHGSNPPKGIGVEHAYHEEGDGRADVDQIFHGYSSYESAYVFVHCDQTVFANSVSKEGVRSLQIERTPLLAEEDSSSQRSINGGRSIGLNALLLG